MYILFHSLIALFNKHISPEIANSCSCNTFCLPSFLHSSFKGQSSFYRIRRIKDPWKSHYFFFPSHCHPLSSQTTHINHPRLFFFIILWFLFTFFFAPRKRFCYRWANSALMAFPYVLRDTLEGKIGPLTSPVSQVSCYQSVSSLIISCVSTKNPEIFSLTNPALIISQYIP